MRRKKVHDQDELPLFPPLKVIANKVIAEQFELKETGQDGLKSFRQERETVYERNLRLPEPLIKPGDKVTTTYSASCKGLIFEVIEVSVSHTVCQSGYHIKAYSEEYKERTGYGYLNLDSAWFEKLLC